LNQAVHSRGNRKETRETKGNERICNSQCVKALKIGEQGLVDWSVGCPRGKRKEEDRKERETKQATTETKEEEDRKETERNEEATTYSVSRLRRLVSSLIDAGHLVASEATEEGRGQNREEKRNEIGYNHDERKRKIADKRQQRQKETKKLQLTVCQGFEGW
jgi:hypothetical protein